jgi:hypothetical protein
MKNDVHGVASAVSNDYKEVEGYIKMDVMFIRGGYILVIKCCFATKSVYKVNNTLLGLNVCGVNAAKHIPIHYSVAVEVNTKLATPSRR